MVAAAVVVVLMPNTLPLHPLLYLLISLGTSYKFSLLHLCYQLLLFSLYLVEESLGKSKYILASFFVVTQPFEQNFCLCI